MDIAKFRMSGNNRCKQHFSAGSLLGLGDIICQYCIEKKQQTEEGYSIKRTGRFFVLGCFWIAPTLRVWFGILTKYVKGPPKLTPLLQVLVDQSLFSPCFLSSILINLRLLEGNSLQVAIKRWRNDFIAIFTTGLMVWPAAQLFNFYLVPLPYRVPYVQVVALFWNTYMSYRTNLPHDIDHGIKAEISPATAFDASLVNDSIPK